MKAAAYPEHWLETVRFHRRFAEHDLNDWLCEQLAPQPHHTSLDIGCGTGEQLLHFASVCRRCIGVDNAELPSEDLRRSFKTRTYATSNGCAAPVSAFPWTIRQSTLSRAISPCPT